MHLIRETSDGRFQRAALLSISAVSAKFFLANPGPTGSARCRPALQLKNADRSRPAVNRPRGIQRDHAGP
jgi:hypothetical protein